MLLRKTHDKKGAETPSEKIVFDYSTPKILRLQLSGDWQITAGLPAPDKVIMQLAAHPDLEEIACQVSATLKWDSGLVSFLLHLSRECQRRHIRFTQEGLPQGGAQTFRTGFFRNERGNDAAQNSPGIVL